ncbi:MAG: metallophosphoesterase [Actinobacteria bacterium]|nr:metallophosphoesterase [Actinomycetota bacterium]
MLKNTFNKFFVAIIIFLTILVVGIKIYSILSFPEISDWNYTQLKKINKEKIDFSFVVFADNKNSIRTFKSLIKKVNNEKALFAIDVGDLVYDGENEKFRFFINQIKQLQKPLLTVIGNHEIKENGRGNYYDFFGRFYYSFAIGNSYFIILDDAKEENIDPWQMEWLKKELQKSQQYKYRFVFMHVPLYDPRKGEFKRGHSLKDLAFAKKLNDLFDQHHVTMIFSSHIHAYYRGTWKETPYIITGGAGAELAGTEPAHYFYHYLVVHVSEQGVHYQIVKLKSPDFEIVDRLTHDLWIYVYAFFSIHYLDILIILAFCYFGVYFIFRKRKKWMKKSNLKF